MPEPTGPLPALTAPHICSMCGDSGVDRWGQSCDCEAWTPAAQPLSSDEEAQAREWFPRIASESDHVWLLQRNRTLRIIDAMWATIDAQNTELAALRGQVADLKAALENLLDPETIGGEGCGTRLATAAIRAAVRGDLRRRH